MPNVTPSTFNIATDPAATFAAYPWASTTIEDDGVAEADLDERNGALWYANVRKALRQISEVFQGTQAVDALVVGPGALSDANSAANDLAVGGLSSGNAGITILSTTSSTNAWLAFTDTTTVITGGVRYQHDGDILGLRAGGSDRVEITSTATQSYAAIARFGASTATLGAASGTPVGTLDTYVQVGNTTASQETGFAVLSNDGSRNTRAQFFIKDAVSGSGLWGLWQTSSSAGNQPFVIGIGNTEYFRISTAGAATFAGSVSLVGETNSATLNMTGVLSPSALSSGTTDDYAPTGHASAFHFRITTDAAGSTLSSLAGGTAGRVIMISNIGGSGALTLVHNSGGTAGNRFILPNGANLVIPIGGTRLCFYDNTSQRWRVLGAVA